MGSALDIVDSRVLPTSQSVQHLQHRVGRVAGEHFKSHKLVKEWFEHSDEEFLCSFKGAVARDVHGPQDPFYDVRECLDKRSSELPPHPVLTDIPSVLGVGANIGQGVYAPATRLVALALVLL